VYRYQCWAWMNVFHVYPYGYTPTTEEAEKTAAAESEPATLVVELPSEALLRIDGQTTTSKSSIRTFTTPALLPGQDYVYTLEAEYESKTGPQAVKRVVTVRAGKATRVSLNMTEASASR
jgi:uncharacterized protein (TIGR03000 family)